MQTADSIVALLNANNGLKVFIAAHADSRGGFEYNLKLTDKRSIAVKRYIMNRGIPSSRIITRGFGESQLLNNCADGISCSEAEHAVNRRVEMKLVR
jgi:outer membrane protein OmpA-like peptidoglycan-associated protein